MGFEEWAESKGFDLSTYSDTQVAALRAAWRAEESPEPTPEPTGGNPAPEPPAPELDAILTRARDEQSRQRQITALVGEAVEENPAILAELEKIGKTAIDKKWTVQQTELAILRISRAPAPQPLNQRGGAPASERVLEAALAQSAGLKGVESAYDARTLEAAHKQFRGGLGLQQLLTIAAQQNGYRGSASAQANLREVMQLAFTPRASGISTISVPGILSNVANKFSREAFMGVEQAWSPIAARRSVPDFKQISSYSLSGDMIYEEIPPGGLIKHGTLTETAYTNQAKSYGKMLGIDRRDLINDDLGVFDRLGRMLGRGGALKINKVFWGEFLNNSSFFAAGNNNVTTGGTSALSLTALQEAETKFRTQTDPDGNLMGVMPKILLVPAALDVTAKNLMNSTQVVATTTANTPLMANNPYAGAFQVVSSAYLTDSTLTGNSSTAWYLLADPNDVPVIEIAFLNGQEMPTVETADADFNQLGIQIRAYHDFGVAKQEYRGGVRAAGA